MSRACPNCQAAVAEAKENRAFPFCSARCKLVDLSRWLGESYRIPGEPVSLGADFDPSELEDGDARSRFPS